MEYKKLTKQMFDLLKEAIQDGIHETCDICGKKITRDTFGYISKNNTSCNDILCISEIIEKEGEN